MPIEVIFNRLGAVSAALEHRAQGLLNEAADSLVKHAVEHMGVYPPASAPGDYPAKRTGDYAAAITAVHDAGHLESQVTAPGVPGLFLEFGTRKMAARPHLTPSAALVGQEIAEKIHRVIG